MRQEYKDKRTAENKGKIDEEPEDLSDDEGEKKEDPIRTICTHMVIGETDKPDLPFKKDANTEEMTKLHDKLMAFKKFAQRKVLSDKCGNHHGYFIFSCSKKHVLFVGMWNDTSIDMTLSDT